MYVVSRSAIQIIAASGCLSWLLLKCISAVLGDPEVDLLIFPWAWSCLWALFCSLVALAIDRYEDTTTLAGTQRYTRRPAIIDPYCRTLRQAYVTFIPTSRKWYRDAREERRIEIFALPLAGAFLYVVPLVLVIAVLSNHDGSPIIIGIFLLGLVTLTIGTVFGLLTRNWRIALDERFERRRIVARVLLLLMLPLAIRLAYSQRTEDRRFVFYIVGSPKEQAGLRINGRLIEKLAIIRPVRPGAIRSRTIVGHDPRVTVELWNGDQLRWSVKVEDGFYLVNVSATRRAACFEDSPPFARTHGSVLDGVSRLPTNMVLFDSNARLPSQPEFSSGQDPVRFAKLYFGPDIPYYDP